MAEVTAKVLCKAAMRKLRILDPAEEPGATELDNVFTEFKRMIKTWGIVGDLVYESTVDQHTLDGSASYTIGDSQTIDTVRPSIILPSSYVTYDTYDYPLTLISERDYFEIVDKDVEGGLYPIYLYYKAEYSAGTLYVYPAGTGTLNLHSLKPLAEPATVDANVVYPDEYQDAIVWNLACRISPEFKGEPTPFLVETASRTISILEAHVKRLYKPGLNNTHIGSANEDLYFRPNEDD